MANIVDAGSQQVFAALDEFRIEVPSWGFANTGTRFGKFIQAGAAIEPVPGHAALRSTW